MDCIRSGTAASNMNQVELKGGGEADGGRFPLLFFLRANRLSYTPFLTWRWCIPCLEAEDWESRTICCKTTTRWAVTPVACSGRLLLFFPLGSSSNKVQRLTFARSSEVTVVLQACGERRTTLKLYSLPVIRSCLGDSRLRPPWHDVTFPRTWAMPLSTDSDSWSQCDGRN